MLSDKLTQYVCFIYWFVLRTLDTDHQWILIVPLYWPKSMKLDSYLWIVSWNGRLPTAVYDIHDNMSVRQLWCWTMVLLKGNLVLILSFLSKNEQFSYYASTQFHCLVILYNHKFNHEYTYKSHAANKKCLQCLDI